MDVGIDPPTHMAHGTTSRLALREMLKEVFQEDTNPAPHEGMRSW